LSQEPSVVVSDESFGALLAYIEGSKTEVSSLIKEQIALFGALHKCSDCVAYGL